MIIVFMSAVLRSNDYINLKKLKLFKLKLNKDQKTSDKDSPESLKTLYSS